MARLFARLGLGLSLALVIYLATRGTVEFPLEPGALYAVATDANCAEFDLPFHSGDAEYLLVVSNEATDAAARRLQVEVAPVAAASSAGLRRVAPLAAMPLDVEIPRSAARVPVAPPAARDFTLPASATEGQRIRVTTRLAGQGRGVRVWVDVRDTLDDAWVQRVVTAYERSVHPLAEKYLGLPADVDADGCFGIVVTSWLGRLAGGRLALGGMVNADDFDDSEDSDANRADVLYLNADLPADAHLETVLAHEFAHAVTASGRTRGRTLLFAARREEAWLNEAIAHVTENLHSDNWSNLDHRVAQFLARPEATPLVVADYESAGLWQAGAPRGSTYLFLRWCVEHYGPGLLPALIYSGRSGVANVEAATGQPFAELHRRFTADLFLRALQAPSPPASTSASLLPAVDLAGRLGSRELAGPRFERWNLADDAPRQETIDVVGTASKYLVISAARSGPRRVRIRATQGASLQVSLVRLPAAVPRLELTAQPEGDGAWRLALASPDGSPVRVERIGWESLASEGPAPFTPRGAGLANCFPLGQLSAEGILTSARLEPAELPRGPLAVHVIGYDAQGRRAAAWTTIDATTSAVHVASAVEDTRRR